MKRPRHTAANLCAVGDMVFRSRAEADHYLFLYLRKKAGEIHELVYEQHFDFIVNGCRVGRGYKVDFTYRDSLDGRFYADEVKGREFRDWPLRRDLFLALYPEYIFRLVTKRGIKVLKRRFAA